jgi:hypothetical protein
MAAGPQEFRRLLEDKIKPLVEGFQSNHCSPQSIFPVKPHTTTSWDSHFPATLFLMGAEPMDSPPL